MSNEEKLGDKIYQTRMSKNISQEYVAHVVGVSRQTVSKWESNSSQPKSENLRLLCKALRVELSYLMPTEEEEEATDKEGATDKEIVTDKKESAEAEVVCDNSTNDETQENKISEVDDVVIQEEPIKRKSKLSKKSKIIITSVVSAIIALFGLSVIVFSKIKVRPNSEGDFGPGDVSVRWNLGIENIGWIIFGIAILIAVVLGVILICKSSRNKK